MVSNDASASDANSLLRIFKVGKLYKILRLVRLVKVFKMIKSQQFFNKLSESLKISSATERLISFSAYFSLFIHVATCVYIYMGHSLLDITDSWIEYAETENDQDLYVLAFYFIVTTVTTVGYGDYSPKNYYERTYCMMLMIIGVSCFTFVSGALSSLMSNYDQRQAELSEKVLMLNKMRQAF